MTKEEIRSYEEAAEEERQRGNYYGASRIEEELENLLDELGER